MNPTVQMTSTAGLGLSGPNRDSWRAASRISNGRLKRVNNGECNDTKEDPESPHGDLLLENRNRSESHSRNEEELFNDESRSWARSRSNSYSVTEEKLERSKALVEQEVQIERDEVPAIQVGGMTETTHFGIKPPLPLYELDRIQKDIALQSFGEGLQKAAEAIFPNDNRSRYTEVHVLLLSWEDEDPNLPVSIDISRLSDLFQTVYGFETSAWQIPAIQSHRETNRKIDQFLGDDDPKHLKVVYYAGHGRLTSSGQLAWTSQRNSANERCPTVKWSGIQSSLEEAQSDVLLLLDCCAAGTANTNEGNGVTELLAACAFNGIANGVGPYSFTHALINQLRLLSSTSCFSTAILFNRLYTEIEGWRLIGKDFQRPPVHLVLSQDAQLPRSIQLSVQRPATKDSNVNRSVSDAESQASACGNEHSPLTESQTSSSSDDLRTLQSDASDASSNTSNTSLSLDAFPRLLFSVHIRENLDCSQLSQPLFLDWLRMIPVLADKVTIEAGFASDSTIVLFSLPAALWQYLPRDPAISLIGKIRSSNLMQCTHQSEDVVEDSAAQKWRLDTLTEELDLPQNTRGAEYGIDELKAERLPSTLPGESNLTEHPHGVHDRIDDAAGEKKVSRILHEDLKGYEILEAVPNASESPDDIRVLTTMKAEDEGSPEDVNSTNELETIFADLGMSRYLGDFVEQGWDTSETVLNITESDFDALGVKLGHRRRLQRKIRTTGLFSDRASAWPSPDAKDIQVNNSQPHQVRRKYRQHPKPDENAPKGPQSAYGNFSNKMREEFKGKNLYFYEIAKQVGDEWQKLSSSARKTYEQEALSAQEIYLNELAEYRKTKDFEEYSRYLAKFKQSKLEAPRAVDVKGGTLRRSFSSLTDITPSVSQPWQVEELTMLLGDVQSLKPLDNEVTKSTSGDNQSTHHSVPDNLSSSDIKRERPMDTPRQSKMFDRVGSHDTIPQLQEPEPKERRSTKKVSFVEEVAPENSSRTFTILDESLAANPAWEATPTKLKPPAFFDPELASHLYPNIPIAGLDESSKSPDITVAMPNLSMLSELGYILDDLLSESSEVIRPTREIQYLPYPLSPTPSDPDFERDFDEWLAERGPPEIATPSLRSASPMDTPLSGLDVFNEEVDIWLQTEAQPAAAPVPSQPTKVSSRLPRKPVALLPLRTPLIESKESQYRVLHDFASHEPKCIMTDRWISGWWLAKTKSGQGCVPSTYLNNHRLRRTNVGTKA